MRTRRSPGSPSQMIAALLRSGPREVPVEAVGGDVELAAHEPLGVRRCPVEHPVPRSDPLQRAGLLRPEAFAVAGAGLVQRRRGVGLGGERGGGREAALLGEEGVELVGHGDLSACSIGTNGRSALPVKICRGRAIF